MILVLTACKNKKEGEVISRVLLQKRLAACSIVLPGVTSVYFWQKKLTKTSEALLLVKTFKEKRAAVEREIARLHSYKIPAIITISAKNVNKIYLQWMKKVIR